MFGLVTRKQMFAEKEKAYEKGKAQGRHDKAIEGHAREYPGDMDAETVTYQEWRDRTEKYWERYSDLNKLFGNRNISLDGRYKLYINLNLYDYATSIFSVTKKKYDDVPDEIKRAHLAIKDRYDRWVAGDGPPPVCIDGEEKR